MRVGRSNFCVEFNPNKFGLPYFNLWQINIIHVIYENKVDQTCYNKNSAQKLDIPRII